MRKKEIIKRILSTVIFIAVLLGLLYCFDLAIYDDTTSYVRVQMHEFYDLEDIDTLFLGASQVRNGINVPMIEENGRENVFSLATANQTAIGGYYLLKEALADHEIDTVIYHASYMRFANNNNANVQGNYILLDEMRFSLNKMNFAYDALDEFAYVDILSKYQRNKKKITLRSMCELLYHKLTDKDYRNYYENTAVPLVNISYVGKGYSYWRTTMEKGSAGTSGPEYNETSPDWEYLERTIELCQENDIEFILIQVPSFESRIFADVESYQAGENKLNAIAQKYGVPYWNFNNVKMQYLPLEEHHFHDHKHLNQPGSDLFTEFLIKMLNEFDSEGDVFDKYCYENWDTLELEHQRIYGSELITEPTGESIVCTLKTTQPSIVQPEYKFYLYIGDKLVSETGWIQDKEYTFGELSKDSYSVTAMARAMGSTEEYEVIQMKEIQLD